MENNQPLNSNLCQTDWRFPQWNFLFRRQRRSRGTDPNQRCDCYVHSKCT